MSRIFSNEDVNTGRQVEFDLVKAATIVLMVWTHVYEELSTGFEPSLSYANAYWRGSLFGAVSFMFCMGIGMVYTRSCSPSDYFRRGWRILYSGVLLNLFRYVVPGAFAYLAFGDQWAGVSLVFALGVDILQFAGLAFLLMGLLRRMGLKYRHIMIVSVAMSIAAECLEEVQTGVFLVDQALGYIWGNTTESYFPVLNWFVIVAAGCCFGRVYRRVADKDRFHSICFPVTFILTAVYLYVSFACTQHVFLQFEDEVYLGHRMLPDSVMSIVANVWLISFFHYAAKTIPSGAIPALVHPSRHINQYYCVSWVVIVLSTALCGYGSLDCDWKVVCAWLAVLLVTIIVVTVYNKWLKAGMSAFFGRRHALWVILAVALTIAGGIWGYLICNGQYPSSFGGYRP